MSGVRSVRIIRGDKRLKSRNLRTNIGAGGCSAITLSDLSSNTAYKSVAYSDSISPSGGAAPYNLSVTSGSLPDGLSLNSVTGAITGTPTTFGINNFTIGGVDASECPVTSKSYTIAVWLEVEGTPGATGIIDFTVADLPSFYGIGVRLSHVLVNGVSTDLTGDDLSVNNGTSTVTMIDPGDMSGTNISGMNVYNSNAAYPLVASGTEPYTGNFKSRVDFNTFAGELVNSMWQLGSFQLDFSSASLFFEPLPMFTVEGQTIGNGFVQIEIPVFGLSTPYSGSQLIGLFLDISCPDNSQLSSIYLVDPGGTAFCQLVDSGCASLSGVDITDAIIINQNIRNNSFITDGSAPYSGIWMDATSCVPAAGFDATFDGKITNGNWILLIHNTGADCDLNEVTIGFNN